MQTREDLLGRGVRLEYLTVGWNVIEGVVSIGAALAAGSVALLRFGVDSLVESISALVLIWRFRAERLGHLDNAAVERVEHRAEKFVAISLLVLGSYILVDSGWSLINGARPGASPLGIVVTALSLGVMVFLARAKRNVGTALDSRARS